MKGSWNYSEQAGITYDLYTTTHTANHFKVAQSIFLALKENGYPLPAEIHAMVFTFG